MFKKVKCYLCRKKDLKENMILIYYGIYSNNIEYYHDKCLKEIILNPEKYNTIMVDRALWCFENKKLNEKKIKERKEKEQQRLDKVLSQIKE